MATLAQQALSRWSSLILRAALLEEGSLERERILLVAKRAFWRWQRRKSQI